MTGFELWTSRVISDLSTNWATTPACVLPYWTRTQSYKDIFSAKLRHPHLERSYWSFNIFQPIRVLIMLKISVHQNIFVGSGQDFKHGGSVGREVCFWHQRSAAWIQSSAKFILIIWLLSTLLKRPKWLGMAQLQLKTLLNGQWLKWHFWQNEYFLYPRGPGFKSNTRELKRTFTSYRRR